MRRVVFAIHPFDLDLRRRRELPHAVQVAPHVHEDVLELRRLASEALLAVQKVNDGRIVDAETVDCHTRLAKDSALHRIEAKLRADDLRREWPAEIARVLHNRLRLDNGSRESQLSGVATTPVAIEFSDCAAKPRSQIWQRAFSCNTEGGCIPAL